MSDEMLYDQATITTLVADLKEQFGQLTMAGQDMEDAANKLEAAWANNSALAGFQGVHSNWKNEYADSLHTLNQVAIAVENAMQSALGADKKIGDGFGGI
ncbi:hypothetical protein OHB26_06755 [Nocardia sp. NBC_01503]|uniref:hypothetical protein n=1 Tax=Nocardia sp. NBC_01503 TaxID=2975997 RepID=UPI002E7C070F|nr:hypothetical protein [Nocardia sp. NBC_01503]WTL33910.1 hypothetical protein OHB26_06755 [Nocardia sp. NBC_01503]